MRREEEQLQESANLVTEILHVKCFELDRNDNEI